MPGKKSISNEHIQDAELWTGRVLRLGVWISASLMIAGLILAVIQPSVIVTTSGNPTLDDLFVRFYVHPFDAVTLLFAGLVVLMLTPVLRVLTAIIGFALEHDLRFVIVSSVVFVMLVGEIVYSILIK